MSKSNNIVASKFGSENFRPLHVRDAMLFLRGDVSGFATEGGEIGANSVVGPNSNPGSFPDVPLVIGIYHCFGEAAQPGNIRSLDIEQLFNFAGNTSISSGQSIAAIRGCVSIASPTVVILGTVVGVQGKLIVQGSLNGGASSTRGTAIQGQLDISTAVSVGGVNDSVSALWLDAGATASAAVIADPGQINLARLTNSTFAIINSAIQVVANAANLFDVTDLNFGGAHFANTSAANPTTAGGQLRVLVNGVVRYIPLFSTSI